MAIFLLAGVFLLFFAHKARAMFLKIAKSKYGWLVAMPFERKCIELGVGVWRLRFVGLVCCVMSVFFMMALYNRLH
jgi:hypothetical protein